MSNLNLYGPVTPDHPDYEWFTRNDLDPDVMYREDIHYDPESRRLTYYEFVVDSSGVKVRDENHDPLFVHTGAVVDSTPPWLYRSLGGTRPPADTAWIKMAPTTDRLKE